MGDAELVDLACRVKRRREASRAAPVEQEGCVADTRRGRAQRRELCALASLSARKRRARRLLTGGETSAVAVAESDPSFEPSVPPTHARACGVGHQGPMLPQLTIACVDHHLAQVHRRRGMKVENRFVDVHQRGRGRRPDGAGLEHVPRHSAQQSPLVNRVGRASRRRLGLFSGRSRARSRRLFRLAFWHRGRFGGLDRLEARRRRRRLGLVARWLASGGGPATSEAEEQMHAHGTETIREFDGTMGDLLSKDAARRPPKRRCQWKLPAWNTTPISPARMRRHAPAWSFPESEQTPHPSAVEPGY